MLSVDPDSKIHKVQPCYSKYRNTNRYHKRTAEVWTSAQQATSWNILFRRTNSSVDSVVLAVWRPSHSENFFICEDEVDEALQSTSSKWFFWVALLSQLQFCSTSIFSELTSETRSIRELPQNPGQLLSSYMIRDMIRHFRDSLGH